MRYKQLCVLLLVSVLMMPLTLVSLLSTSEEEVVCELLEDFNEEEEAGDNKEGSDCEESELIPNKFYPITAEFQPLQNFCSYFEKDAALPSSISSETGTPPPELS